MLYKEAYQREVKHARFNQRILPITLLSTHITEYTAWHLPSNHPLAPMLAHHEAALFIGVMAYLIGLWNAEMMLNRERAIILPFWY